MSFTRINSNLHDLRKGRRGLFEEENQALTAETGSKSARVGPSSEILIKCSRFSPPRLDLESFLILFWVEIALSQWAANMGRTMRISTKCRTSLWSSL